MSALRLFVLVMLQALLLSDVAPFGDWTRPQWALWGLFMLPLNTSPFIQLFAGFLLGLGLDVTMGTYGHHMIAGTALGGCLPTLHQLMSPREGYEMTTRPTLRDMGAGWVIATTFLGALVFHVALAIVDQWQASLIARAIAPAITSALWTTLCCLLLHLLVAPSRIKAS